MKKILIIIIVVFTSNFIYSQDIKLHITNNGDPVGFAYILLNNNVVCSADSAGVATLSRSCINEGDTLTASFMGTTSENVVYRNNDQNITIELDNQIYLSDITIRAKDKSWNLFNRYVEKGIFIQWKSKYFCELKVVINRDTIAQGNLKYQMIPEENYRKRVNVFKYDDFKQKEDIGIDLKATIERSFLRTLFAFGPYTYLDKKDTKCLYLGESNGEQQFFFTLPWSEKNVNYQTVLYSDTQSKKAIRNEIFLKDTNTETQAECWYAYRNKNIYITRQIVKVKLIDSGTEIELIMNNGRLEFDYEGKTYI